MNFGCNIGFDEDQLIGTVFIELCADCMQQLYPLRVNLMNSFLCKNIASRAVTINLGKKCVQD